MNLKITKRTLQQWGGEYPPKILPFLDRLFSENQYELLGPDPDGRIEWLAKFEGDLSIVLTIEGLGKLGERKNFRSQFLVYSNVVTNYCKAIRIWECTDRPYEERYHGVPTGVLAGNFALLDAKLFAPHQVFLESFSDCTIDVDQRMWETFFVRTVKPMMDQVNTVDGLRTYLFRMANRDPGSGWPGSTDKHMYCAILFAQDRRFIEALAEIEKGLALVRPIPRFDWWVCQYERMKIHIQQLARQVE